MYSNSFISVTLKSTSSFIDTTEKHSWKFPHPLTTIQHAKIPHLSLNLLSCQFADNFIDRETSRLIEINCDNNCVFYEYITWITRVTTIKRQTRAGHGC